MIFLEEILKLSVKVGLQLQAISQNKSAVYFIVKLDQ